MEMVAGKKIARPSSNAGMKTRKCRLLPQAALICLSVFSLAPALAQAFSFEIASPVAAQDFRFKSAAFVFRTTGCPEPAKAEITATGEGLAGGAYRQRFDGVR